MRLPQPPLLLITDRLQAAHALPEIIEAGLRAGCRWVSVREKDLPEQALFELLTHLRRLTDAYGALISLHGSARQALHAGLNAVHLSAGTNTFEARQLLGKEALIGISVHGVDEIAALDPSYVDYAILGPIFLTGSKPGYGPALGSEGFGEAVRASRVPVVAVGGISAENMPDVRISGATGIAVMGGVMRASDPGRFVRETLKALL